MKIGRRAVFFGGLAIVCLLLWEPTPPEYRWVNLFAAGLALLWAVAAAAEDRSLRRWRPRDRSRRSPTDGGDEPVRRA